MVDRVDEVFEDTGVVVIGLGAPGRVLVGCVKVDLGAVEVPEEIARASEVVPDGVEDHRDADAVELVHHVFQVVGCAEFPIPRELGECGVSAREVALELVDRVDHDGVHAELGEMGDPITDGSVGRGIRRAAEGVVAAGERANVQLVDDQLIEGVGGKRIVLPLVRERVGDDGVLVVGGVDLGGPRVGVPDRVVEEVLVHVADLRGRDDSGEVIGVLGHRVGGGPPVELAAHVAGGARGGPDLEDDTLVRWRAAEGGVHECHKVKLELGAWNGVAHPVGSEIVRVGSVGRLDDERELVLAGAGEAGLPDVVRPALGDDGSGVPRLDAGHILADAGAGQVIPECLELDGERVAREGDDGAHVLPQDMAEPVPFDVVVIGRGGGRCGTRRREQRGGQDLRMHGAPSELTGRATRRFCPPTRAVSRGSEG